MSRPPKTTYKTTNWQNYNQALRQRGSLTVWFDPSMHWEAIPSGRRGRQQAYSDAAIQACLTLKTLLGLPLRQATGFVASLLELSGLGWSVPDFSTLSRRQKTLNVTIPYRGSKGPLHLLVDSTGIKVEGEGEWHTRKHGGSKRRVWRKLHLGIDEETLEIRGRSRSPPAMSATRRCCRTCLPSCPRIRRLPPLQQTVPTTRAPATTPSLTAVRQQSFRPAATRDPGSRTRQEPERATRYCGRKSILAGRCGGTGAATTDVAEWKRK